jgi:hypothetical protein
MPDYAHKPAKLPPWWKRCKTRHSPRTPQRCRKERGHDGGHRFGWWEQGVHTVNLDLELPPIVRGTDD